MVVGVGVDMEVGWEKFWEVIKVGMLFDCGASRTSVLACGFKRALVA